jgi:hypothetical protein
MKPYFQNFPKTFYNLSNNNTDLDVVTNLTNLVTLDSSIKTNGSSFYNYIVEDGDTPEIIAGKIYDNPQYHWIILMLNDIVHPQFDWALDSTSLNLYIDSKYTEAANNTMSGLDWARTNVKEYRKIVKRINPITNDSITETIVVDANTYSEITISTNQYTLQSGSVINQTVNKDFITYYFYEQSLNDVKRNIKILRPQFVETISRQLEDKFIK